MKQGLVWILMNNNVLIDGVDMVSQLKYIQCGEEDFSSVVL